MLFIQCLPAGLVALFGVLVGSFCNVCILRLPLGESIVTTPSHCPHCQRRLSGWELIPLLSYVFLGGRCAGCRAPISIQYPLVELGNGILWLLVYLRFGASVSALLSALLCSVLLVASVIDAREQILPVWATATVVVLGMVQTVFQREAWQSHLLGFVLVSGVLFVIYLLSGGSAIGGGDIKLMAGTGLFLGASGNVLAFLLGCLLASLMHPVRMRFFGAGRTLALGPYLSAGVVLSLLWGQPLLHWYFSLF